MGGAKNLKLIMVEKQAAEKIGIEIGVRAGVLERCLVHEECYWDTGEHEREAYKLGSILVRDGDALVAGFDIVKIFNGLKVAIGGAELDGCPHCAKNMEDD